MKCKAKRVLKNHSFWFEKTQIIFAVLKCAKTLTLCSFGSLLQSPLYRLDDSDKKKTAISPPIFLFSPFFFFKLKATLFE